MTGRQKIFFDVERSNVDIFCEYKLEMIFCLFEMRVVKVTELREGEENHNTIQRIAKNLHLILLYSWRFPATARLFIG